MKSWSRLSTYLGVTLLGLTLIAPSASAYELPVVDRNSLEFKNFVQASKDAGATDAEIEQTVETMTSGPNLEPSEGVTTYAGKAQPNGCSDPVPHLDDAVKYQFDGPCNLHDICYSAEENNGRPRVDCDNEFKKNMEKVCNTNNPGQNPNVPSGLHACLTNARAYYFFVRTFGKDHFKGSGDPS
ncbi:phospholipase A2 [uncultured Kocuria sp.]|uniref:phospholipase A2 n=1 Tax=uncultured Kocuria sp. TaxID=259305 RepID=UPI0025960866|nr:phospholipase A2 [uncultured Kocuria sp.]MCT1368412.1 phospholipase [Rothia sp. p3-SID1597]